MSSPADVSATTDGPSRYDTVRRWGLASWFLFGIVLFASVVFAAVSALSGLLVPLTIGTLLGILASPLVDLFNRHRIPRWLGATIVMVGLLLVVVGSVVISVRGVIDQSDEISDQITAGLTSIQGWFDEHDADLSNAGDRIDQLGSESRSWIGGLASYAGTIFTSAAAFLFGSFMSAFFTFYMLSDWHRVRDWIGAHLGVPEDLGSGMVDDVTQLIRRGFYALSLSSLLTALLIGGTMLVLDLPLAFTVALVTFVTSYIPYLGAIFAGAFGFLVALGAGGLTDAIILLIVILLVQNVVQTVVGNRLVSSSLALHPIASLISTIIGAVIAGLLGAMLSAPILAAIIAIRKRILAYRVAERDYLEPAAHVARAQP